MKAVYSDKYYADIGQHVFPMAKYRLVRDELLRKGILGKDDFIEPESVEESDVLLVHTREYVNKLKTGTLSPMEEMVLELPYSRELVEASFLMAGGAITASRVAVKEGVGVSIGGGFHHAFPDHGEGFCVLNDVAIAIRRMQKERKIHRALVIDCDLHQGNGTASIFKGDKEVFTFSIHQENNYPMHKPASSLDIGLRDLADDGEYLGRLKEHLPRIIDFNPDIVLYLAGADIYEHDQLGGLSVTMSGVAERDRLIINGVRSRDIPLAIVLAGGYAVNTEDTVRIHCNTIEIASRQSRTGGGR